MQHDFAFSFATMFTAVRGKKKSIIILSSPVMALEIMKVVYASHFFECKHTTGKKTDNIHGRQT